MTKKLTMLQEVRKFVAANKRNGISNDKHTKQALMQVLAVVDHTLKHRDWDALAVLIAKTDSRMSTKIRAIVNNVIGGITIAKDKKHHTGMRVKLADNFGPTEKLEVLRDLVNAGTPIYSPLVNQGLLGEEAVEQKPKSKKDALSHIQAYLAKHGFELHGDIVELDALSLTV